MGGGYIILIILVGGLSLIVSMRFKSKFKKYAETPNGSGLTGREIAERMLHDNGITDVQVLSSNGMLSDHYNPVKKTVNLSPDVYNGTSVAAAAVSAHECGHAIQHKEAYSWLTFRSKMVPVVSFAGNIMPFILIGGILTLSVFPELLLAGIVLFAFTTVFSFVTLPVEYDASNRALKWLSSTNITIGKEHEQAKDALKWAANTYVAAAIGSLVTLLYYVSIFLGRRG